MITKNILRRIMVLSISICMLFMTFPLVFAEENEDNIIIVSYIYDDEFFLSENEVVLSVEFEDKILDARSNLTVSLEDSLGQAAATQKKCVYSDDILLYTLEAVDGYDFLQSEDYNVKFTYNGIYSFEDQTGGTIISPNTRETIIKENITNKNSMAVEFYIANFDESAEYVIEYGNTMYETVSVGNNIISVELGEINSFLNSDSEKYYSITLNKKSGNSTQYLSSYRFSASASGKMTYDDNSYNGIGNPDRISPSASFVPFYMYNYRKGNTYPYDSSVIENCRIYMVDSVTRETVGEALEPELTQNGVVESKIQITGNLESDRRYFIMADDGNSVRISSVYTSDAFYYEFCGIKYGENSYRNRITDLPSYECLLSGVCNMLDISKLNVVIYDKNGNEAAVLEKGSITAVDDNGSNYLFRMKRTAEAITEDNKYIMMVYYDGILAGSSELYYSENKQNTIYVEDIYQTDSEIYLLIDSYELENYSVDEFSYSLINSVSSEEISGIYERVIDDYYVVKFDGTMSIEEVKNEEWYFKAENTEISLMSNPFYTYKINEEQKPFIYDMYNKEEGNIYFYGEGLSNDKEYTLHNVFDELSGMEKEINLVPSDGMLSFSEDDLKFTKIDDYVYIEEDGVFISQLYGGEFTSFFCDEFYAEYRNQNHTFAVLNLPSDIYSEYKLADSEEGLEEAEYEPIKESVIYQLPNSESKYTVYAKFKTETGTETTASTSINYDKTAPDLSVSGISDKYTLNRYGKLIIPAQINATERGYIYYSTYDRNGIEIGYNRCISVEAGSTNTDLSFYGGNNTDFTQIERISFYMEDMAGNKSEEKSFTVEVINPYYTYEIPGGSILFDTSTGTVVDIETEFDRVAIPQSINGVAVTAIGINAFGASCTEIRIPQSVTQIEYNRVLRYKKLLVKDGSYALAFAQEKNLDYEIVTTEAGDVNDDGYVNSDDTIYLSKHIEQPEQYPLAVSGDIDGNGQTEYSDAVQLLKNVIENCTSSETADSVNISIDSKNIYQGDNAALMISAQEGVQIKALMLYDLEYDSALSLTSAELAAKGMAMGSCDSNTGTAVYTYNKNTDCGGSVLKLAMKAVENMTGSQNIICKAVATVIENGIEKKITVNVTGGNITIDKKPSEIVSGVSFKDSDSNVITNLVEASGKAVTAKVDISAQTLAEADSITLYFAQYDKNGVLTDIKSEKNIRQSNVYEINPGSDTNKIKVFMWDTLNKPLSVSGELK